MAGLLENRNAPSRWFSLIPILGSPPGRILKLPMIEALAAHYIEELRTVQSNGPYFLIGYSWGDLVAYEMAQQLTGRGEVVELVALVDTALPDPFRNPFSDRAVRIMSYSPARFYNILKYKVKTRFTKKWLRHNVTLTLKKWRYGYTYYRPDSFDIETVYTVIRAYRPSTYSGRVIFFRAAENLVQPYGFHKSYETEWKRLVGQGLEIEQLACDHAMIMKGSYVAQIAHRVRAAIDRATNGGRRTKGEGRAHAEHSADAVTSS